MIYYARALFSYDRKQTIKFICGLSFGVALCQFLSVLTNTPAIMSNYAIISPLLVNDITLFQIFVIIMFFLYPPILHWHLFQIQSVELHHFSIVGMSRNDIKKLFFLEVCVLDVCSIGLGLVLGEIFLLFTRFCIQILIQRNISFAILYGTQIKQFVIEIMLAIFVAILFTFIGIEKEPADKWISKKLMKIAKKERMSKISIALQKDKISFSRFKSHKKISNQEIISTREHFISALKLEIVKKDRGLIRVISLWISIFFIATISFVLTHHSFKVDDMKSTPFDFVSASYEETPSITSKQITDLLVPYKGQIKDKMTVLSCRDNAFSYFSIQDINRIFHTHYKIKRGYFLQDYRVYSSYTKKDFLSSNQIVKTINGEDYLLKKQGNLERMLFGYHHSIADQLILLNDSDFQMIRQESSNTYKQEVVIVNWKNQSATDSFLKEIKRKYSAQLVYENFSSKVQNLNEITSADQLMMFTLVPIFLLQCSFAIEQYVFLKQKQKSRQKEDFFALRVIGYNEKEVRVIKGKLSRFLIKFFCMEIGSIVLYFLLWVKVITILS